ncbi:MAG: hypothetical protein H6732_04960 [Alphaproteobacteria bacterium]|nr:hypothetical protein [Alphaproteobacteria bacterium]
MKRSLNERNRSNKLTKLGYSTSEDAITWTLVSWLAEHPLRSLASLAKAVGIRSDVTPAVLLWGVPIAGSRGAEVRQAVIGVLDKLGERPNGRTEPDVVLDFGSDGIIVIEVKHLSPNDVQPARHAGKFAKYVEGNPAFADPDATTRSGFYELARNWAVGSALASDHPFALINLGPDRLFRGRAGQDLAAFERTLDQERHRTFRRLTWPDFLRIIAPDEPLPLWLNAWLATRGIPA